MNVKCLVKQAIPSVEDLVSINIMPYVNSSGTVIDNRSKFSLSYLVDFFWAIVNTFGNASMGFLIDYTMSNSFFLS